MFRRIATVVVAIATAGSLSATGGIAVLAAGCVLTAKAIPLVG
jgi:hypothetical protein